MKICQNFQKITAFPCRDARRDAFPVSNVCARGRAQDRGARGVGDQQRRAARPRDVPGARRRRPHRAVPWAG